MRCASPLFVCSFTLQSVVLSAALCTNSAEAALVGNYVVGSGANASFIQFQFTNENTYLYEVRYNGSMTGRALFDVVAAAQPGLFSFTYDSFSFGDFVTGITIGADTDFGYGSPPDYLDYWHYWTRASGTDAWTESFIGFADRVVANGSWDGWAFNSASAPNAVPAPGALALLAGGLLTTRRRR